MQVSANIFQFLKPYFHALSGSKSLRHQQMGKGLFLDHNKRNAKMCMNDSYITDVVA